MSGPTKGPWKAVECAIPLDRQIEYVTEALNGNAAGASLFILVPSDSDPRVEGHIVIATTGNGPCSAPNARLAASAPCLLAALELSLPYLEACAEEQTGYGFFPGGDPRKFHPDEESNSAEEIAAHKAACEAMDAGTSKGETPACQHLATEAGVAHVNTGKFGMGSYTYEDTGAVAARDAARAAIAKARGVQAREVTQPRLLTGGAYPRRSDRR